MTLTRPRRAFYRAVAGAAGLLAACTHPRPAVAPAAAAVAPATPPVPEPKPIIPPREAFARGWMPLKSTGVEEFLAAHQTYDGRGVLIGILDSGIDPSIPGLGTTTTGERKILDLRDFSGEGEVTLAPVTPVGDEVTIAGRTLRGVSRVRALAAGGALYGGSIAEIPLGGMPEADLNGDHDDSDTLPVLVARASDGWVLFADTDGDGSLANESPVHDYLVSKETFGWHTGPRAPTLGLAVNLGEENGQPRLDLYFDTSAHGSHVAGIAAGHDIYGVKGFNGVAPGASLLGLKIANDAQGGISTSGSMLAAIGYAIRFARERRLPLVLNMSFGVGNEREGRARIDQLVDSILAAHPDVIFTISAGNDGPGLSTMGFPGSASRAISIGATFPSVFLGASGRDGDPVAYFSSRGGELAKPDIVAPGIAYSTVPRWNTGDEQKGGTSMASPHAAGLVALLVSGLAQEKRGIDARQIRQALMVTARPVRTETFLDAGTGVPDLGSAWQWLAGDHSLPDIVVRAGDGVTAAYRHLAPGARRDTTLGYTLTLPASAAEIAVTLRSDQSWLHAPASARLRPGSNALALSYGPSAVAMPGVYTGIVTGWTSDTLAGPVFRLVSTLVVTDTTDPVVANLGDLPPGGEGRVFFEARADRPFAVGFTTRQAGQQLIGWLHEPGGQPYRDRISEGLLAGYGEDAGTYVVDASDVVPGLYEAVASAPPLQGVKATVVVVQSPLTIAAAPDSNGVRLTLRNLSPETVITEPYARLVGGAREIKVVAQGTRPQRIRFQLPGWAAHAIADVTMAPEQWPLFTDFGVTLFDSVGRQLGKEPLNYAFGRMSIDLPRGRDLLHPQSVELSLLPGLADAAPDQRWTANVTIRLYADSADVTTLPGKRVSIDPDRSATVLLPVGQPPLALGAGFVPLGIVVVTEQDRTWTREVPFPAPVSTSTQ